MVLWGFRNLYEARKTACLDVHQCVWAVLTLLCHIYKITTWWGVSVCKKMQSKTKQTNKKIRQQEAISLAGDQLITSPDWRASARRIVANRSERCFNWAGPHQRGGNCSGSWQRDDGLLLTAKSLLPWWRLTWYSVSARIAAWIWRHFIENYKNAKYLEPAWSRAEADRGHLTPVGG